MADDHEAEGREDDGGERKAVCETGTRREKRKKATVPTGTDNGQLDPFTREERS